MALGLPLLNYLKAQMSQTTNNGIQSNLVSPDLASEQGKLYYIIRSSLSGLRTSMPVLVKAVSNNGGLSPIGTVDVQPMVSMLDGSGNAWPHGIIYNVPYMRIQGGSNGIILDPAVGDIGIATVCDRDISTVQNTGKVSAPGSLRKNDMSDMVYLMTIIGAAPTQYIQFNSAGITITSPTAVTINANITVNGTITATGDIIGQGTSLHTHTHKGVTTGAGNTGTPN